MPTASLTIDRTSLSLSDLVFEGNDGSTPFGLGAFQTPVYVPRTQYAQSRWIDGSFPVSSVWEHSQLTGTLILSADTAADLASAKAEVVAALGRMSYEVTTEQNGVEQTWTADRGSLVLAGDLDIINLRELFEVYRFVIPVHPLVVA